MKQITNNPDLIITADASIRQALKQIDNNCEGVLFVVGPSDRLIGVATDGDLRRAILSGKSITETIEDCFNPNPYFVYQQDFRLDLIRKTFVENRIEVVPILTTDHSIIGYETWDELLGEQREVPSVRQLDIPVVVMAGGKGTRMAPFTSVLPKPLIPIGEKTILELIVAQFRRFAISEYYFTINFRGEMIRAYFDCIERDYKLNYLKETEFFGTAGSLRLLPEGFSSTFIVSNCDIIVKADFAEVVDFHRESGAVLTIISSIQHHIVPYGVIKFSAGGTVQEIQEKPEFSYCINTGVYVLEPECLPLIPEQRVFHMTDLIERLMELGKKVVTYPVNESEYIDVGQWSEYRQAVEALGEHGR